MVNLKKSIQKITIIAIVLIAIIMKSNVYADTTVKVVGPASETPTTSTTVKTTTTPTTAKTTTPATTKTTTPASTTTPATTSGKLPQTGVEDSTGLIVLIVVCGIISVFSFKKMREIK